MNSGIAADEKRLWNTYGKNGQGKVIVKWYAEEDRSIFLESQIM